MAWQKGKKRGSSFNLNVKFESLKNKNIGKVKSSYEITNLTRDVKVRIDEGYPASLEFPIGVTYDLPLNDPEIARKWEDLRLEIEGFAHILIDRISLKEN